MNSVKEIHATVHDFRIAAAAAIEAGADRIEINGANGYLVHQFIADVTPLGACALANPHFVQQLKTGAQLNEPELTTFYGGDSKGYTITNY